MAFDTRTHIYERNGQQANLTKYQPYVRLKNPNNGQKAFVRDGKVFDPSGEVKKEAPDWCMRMIEGWEDDVKRQMGFEHLCKKRAKVDSDLPLEQRVNKAIVAGLITEEEAAALRESEPLEVKPVEVTNSEEAIALDKGYNEMTRPQLLAACKELGIDTIAKDTRESLLEKIDEHQHASGSL
jgi:hypothetical protein